MAKFQSPLLGYNNNVRHKNRVFHIQTEDSGVNHPHVITHLFMDGGRILKSVKKSYAEHVGTDGMNEVVKLMMKEQHKAMFIALRDGQFDHLVGGGEAAASKPPAAGSVAPPTAAAAPAVAPPVVAVAAVAAPKIADKVEDPKKVDTAPEMPASQKPDSAPMTTREEKPPAVSIDYEAVERAGENDVNGPLFGTPDLPPPPKHLFAREPGTGGAYRAVDSDPPPPRSAREPAIESKPPTGEGRYAPARPAAIFGTSPSVRPAPSIFSDELISDKSLDEVILSYLAEDLEPPRRK